MFEEEAEEWVVSHVCKDCSRYEKCKSKEHCTCKECTREKWQNGAEFGYNKGKAELRDKNKYLELYADLADEKVDEVKGELNRIKEELAKAKKLLSFWVNDFYDAFNNSIKYEERHKVLVESEQFLKEVE